MNEIIIIRISDPDGKVFQQVKNVLKDYAEDMISIDAAPNTTLTFPGLIIQIETGTVLRKGCPVQLNYGEFSMLCHLARHPGIILSKDQLYYATYGEDHFSSNTVPSTICRIRSKIEPDPHHPIYIKTVIGMGYKFESPQ